MTGTLAAPSSSVRPPLAGGLALIAVLVFGLGGWAGLAPLAGAVVTSGTVKADGNWREVQHPRGGRVTALLVRDGALVEEGQALLRLDAERDESTFTVLETRYLAARASLARLEAERDGDAEIAFPDVLLAREGEKDVADMLASERQLFALRASTAESEEALIAERVARADQEIAGLRARRHATDEQIRSLREQKKSIDELAQKGYAPANQVRALAVELANATAEAAELDAKLTQAERTQDAARLELARMRASRASDVVAELAEAQGNLTDLKERLDQAAYEIDGLIVRAPIAGRVIGLAVNTVGAVVGPGDTILEIVPAGESLIVEGKVAPRDIDLISQGQEVELRFSALSSRDPPKVKGRLSYISPDAMITQQTQTPSFLVRVEIEEEAGTSLGRARLVPGLPAEMYILTAERTALDYFLSPLKDAMAHAWRES
ncbi:MAG: HlyD family type I secretion periplasmic adaptor subunit [Alphaproteobacteria bacterium]|nr:HlyD family type I secretion periplasmic adaptor subunit [Alphaproteobacteria bacterium]